MRNPERINQVLDLINQIWQKQPDTRFNQLISNLQWGYVSAGNAKTNTLYKKEEHDLITAYRMEEHVDLFSVEDDKFIKYLESIAKEEQHDNH